jgi:hypothetical protein
MEELRIAIALVGAAESMDAVGHHRVAEKAREAAREMIKIADGKLAAEATRWKVE